jgi:hypothetical protein
MAARPPWTVHTVFQFAPPHRERLYETQTELRWLFAPSGWDVIPNPNESRLELTESGTLSEVINIKSRATLRFDLLALEIFIASVIAGGLCMLAVRTKALPRHKQLSP